ncbi:MULTISPECIES: DegT/DnrJ/EryC1/StrS family aminotransferase [unclassified Devosia]|uniref:DegT/DnrJ/EryC1/StrS family aminotransferase n=1 Tax=unclassified Devosia TaxID=196773 RepID=UPI0008694C71|nr:MULTISPECIES: DegT/DnrJ/EryC1/StrS family aminotransferase [unclassified Devosia]MBN9363130.1 DegT/DnrJ/EryC1/StrS family aminotransferase [Devosia sp.]ODS87407.1 MAG: erythromycin biosynthesis sensory transduction protein eryC1 [Devosia sp. SCN 66-27]OJX23375.1 MAG: erythromycin biosynthesis sensory transduction protein eryC1 [Devosia sp. 66-14]
MAVSFLDLNKQYQTMKAEIDAAIATVIADGTFIKGPHADRFEAEFAAYQRVGYCIGCANGTDAIEMALEALDLPKGSEVIVPANTFISTSEAVTRSGLKVVFCDCDPEDYTISIEGLQDKITAKTSAVIPVHLYGQPCDMEAVMQVAGQHGLKVIEDSAQAHGAEFRGQRVGTFGDFGTFSFYPGKNLGAYGDAGVMVTGDAALAEKVRKLGNHGRISKYDHEFEGRNSRLDGMQAAILSVKLRRLDDWISQRIAVAEAYYDALSGVGDLVLPARRQGTRHVYHLFVVRTSRRDALRSHLSERGIESGVHYPKALPKLQAYAAYGQAAEPFFANRADAQVLSLPIGEHMSLDDVQEVAAACIEFFRGAGNPF